MARKDSLISIFQNKAALEQREVVNSLDLRSYRAMYGKVDTRGNALLPSEGFLERASPDGTVVLTNFVSDAFRDLQRHMHKAVSSGLLSRSDVLTKCEAVSGWSSINQSYFQYVNEVYVEFVKNYLDGVRISNFQDFTENFLEYMKLSRNPITRTAFILSGRSGVMSTGMAVEIDQGSYGNLTAKIDNFYENENFEFFSNAAKFYGFRVDEHIPWRLVADLKSPYMAKYMQSRGVSFEDVFEKYFYKSHTLDISTLKSIIGPFYSSYANQTDGRFVIGGEQSDEFWLHFYLEARFVESASPKNLKTLKRATSFLYRSTGSTSKPLEFINNSFKNPIFEKKVAIAQNIVEKPSSIVSETSSFLGQRWRIVDPGPEFQIVFLSLEEFEIFARLYVELSVVNIEPPSVTQYLYTAGSDGTLKKHTLDGTLMWTFTAGGPLVVAEVDSIEGVVYTYEGQNTTGGTYYKVNAETGAQIWSRPRFSTGTHGPVVEPNMALKDGVLFMGPGNEGQTNNWEGFLYARDLETDTTLWKLFPSLDGNHRKITIYDNHIYSLALGNRFFAAPNAVRKIGLDGSLIWQATNVQILALSVNSLGAYTATSGLGTVDQRSLSTGEVLNTLTSFDATLVLDTDINENGSLLVGTNQGVVLHDAITNTRKWRFPLSIFFRVVAIDANEQCYSGADNGVIRCHAVDTGAVLWQSTAHTGTIYDMRVADV